MLHDVDLQEYRYPQLHYALKRAGAAPMTWEEFKELPTADTPEDIANIPIGAILLHEHDFPPRQRIPHHHQREQATG